MQSSDTFWSAPRPHYPPGTDFVRPATGGTVAVSGASLSLPLLRDERTAFVFPQRIAAVAPELTLSAAQVEAAETAFRLPPRMR